MKNINYTGTQVLPITLRGYCGRPTYIDGWCANNLSGQKDKTSSDMNEKAMQEKQDRDSRWWLNDGSS